MPPCRGPSSSRVGVILQAFPTTAARRALMAATTRSMLSAIRKREFAAEWIRFMTGRTDGRGRACPTDLCVTQLCARGAGASVFDCQKKWKQRLPCHCHHRERTFPGDSRSAGRFSSTSPKPPPFALVRIWRFDFETLPPPRPTPGRNIWTTTRQSSMSLAPFTTAPFMPARYPAGRGQGLIPKTTMASEHDLL